ncbi:MAG TPA: LysR family transcriptional regulator [Rhodobacterales bacterium]|nr:LysR family transcriptional regulator [Rhodobacterales bacterium]
MDFYLLVVLTILMDWSRLPSLAALRAFDALARDGSLSAAARRLNVTHAAIAQHLRALEQHFGEKLAVRSGQAMQLTDTGRELASAISDGFGRIEHGVTRIMDRTAQRPVVVSLTPSFAESWLMPKLGNFWAAHPDIELRLCPSMALVDLRRDGIDLAIRFGAGGWPGVDSDPLDLSRFVVVAAPGYCQVNGLEAVLSSRKHIWFVSSAAREQRIWSREIDVDLEKEDVRELPSNGLVLSAIRSGLGLGVQSRALVEPDLESGQLVALYEGDPGGLGYHILTLPGVMPPAVAAFRKWLKRAAQPQT